MSVCLDVCAIGCSFFQGLSLALRAHDQFHPYNWSSLPSVAGAILQTAFLQAAILQRAID